MKRRKITLREFFEINIRKVIQMSKKGELNNKKIKSLSKLWARVADLRTCDIFLENRGAIILCERK